MEYLGTALGYILMWPAVQHSTSNILPMFCQDGIHSQRGNIVSFITRFLAEIIVTKWLWPAKKFWIQVRHTKRDLGESMYNNIFLLAIKTLI